MADNKLFGEFPPVSTEKWEEVINKDLKGADYEKKLVWRTPEGFKVKPYYRQEDLQGLEYLESNPGQWPYTRGHAAKCNDWEVRQDIAEENVEEANRKALDAVGRGATALGFNMSAVQTEADMERLLEGIYIDAVSIHFMQSEDYRRTLQLYVDYAARHGFDRLKLRGSCRFDPFSHALIEGEFRKGEEGDFEEARALLDYASKELPQFRLFSLGGWLLHNSGATAVQELGFCLAEGSEMVYRLQQKGADAAEVCRRLVFNTGLGSTYFMEIAKIRAARLLWSAVAKEYAPADEEAARLYVAAETGRWNSTIYDAYVNMLRSTTEAMSAAVAGAASISVRPFDGAYKPADDFGYRIARNQQLLLKEESYMDKTVDPAAGSYYIENLTDCIASAAWDIFLHVEEAGGMCAAMRSAMVQEAVEESAQRKAKEVSTRRTTLVGTNQYPNLGEAMSEKVDPEVGSSVAICADKEEPSTQPATTLRRLHPCRGAEPFERLRLQTEKAAHRPRVFLLTYGNLGMRRARSGFASNFFGVAGYEVIDTVGFASPEEGVQAALDAKADVVVFCSSDEEYEALCQAAAPLLKGRVRRIVVAGQPGEKEEMYRSLGVDEFIHVKTNVLECLKAFQEALI